MIDPTPQRTLGDLAALLPAGFMWGDSLQPETLAEILDAYDAQKGRS